MPRRILEHLRNDLKRIRTKDSFARNVFTIFSGNSVVLISQLLLTPLIARIYGPEVYGIYGLFLALVVNMAAFADLGYSTAYVLPKEDREAMHLLRLNLFLLLVLTCVALVIGLLRHQLYAVLPDWSRLGKHILLLPVGLLGFGLIYFFTNVFTRHRAFSTSVYLGSTTTVSIRVFNLIYGVVSKGALFGLIIGDVLMNALASVAYWIAMRRYGISALFSGWDWKAIRAVAIAYKRYPLLTFPERWVSQLSGQLPIFLLIKEPGVVGQFALSTSLLTMPLRLLGYSLNNVYIQKAAATAQEDPEHLGRITRGLYLRLFWIGLLPFTLLVFFSDLVFVLVMGEAWHGAGVITGYLGVFFLFRLVSEPMITLFYAQRKEHTVLFFGIGLGAARLVAIVGALYLGASALSAILAFALVSALGYILLGYLLLRHTGQAALPLTLRSLLITLLTCVILALLRFLIIGDWFPGALGPVNAILGR
ncbi:MAG: lipopolysaccharide biosynthesis protein [Flavobacteriales bacterium]|nr:lipopolysaccharide biosynthesis protein [Flavobacteriales bacterium]